MKGFGIPYGYGPRPYEEVEPKDAPQPVATLDVELTNDGATDFTFDLVDRDAVPEELEEATTAAPFNGGGGVGMMRPMIMDCFRCRVAPWMQTSWGEKLIVKAVITEGPTGVEQDAESTITTAKYPFNHKFEVSRDFFIRGLPFTGSL